MAPAVDLPTELLFEIVAHLDLNDYRPCIALALTCRRFYDAFMPWVHADQIKHFTQLLDTPRLRITERIEALTKDISSENSLSQGVTADPFGAFIGRLEFAVGGSEKELQAVLGVISRAKFLEGVDLQLGYSCSQRRIARAIDVCLAKRNLSLAVRGIVPDLRRGPFRYELLDSPCDNEAHSLPHSVHGIKPTSVVHFFKSFLTALTTAFSRTARRSQQQVPQPIGEISHLEYVSSALSVSVALREPKFRFTRHPCPQLATFSIETDALFLPSLYPVTLNALNNSPIHTLSISNTTLSLYDWAHILPSIMMPVLKCFSIGHAVSIAFPDILAFLHRHQSIETLDFIANDVIGTLQFPPSPKFDLLPRLSSLIGHTGYLIPFLRHKRTGYFNSLQNISVNGSDVDLDILFNLLSKGGFKDLTLNLDDASSMALFEWILYAHLAGGSKRPLRLAGVTCLIVRFSRGFGNIIANWSKERLENWEANNLSLVKQLEAKRNGKLPVEKHWQITEALIWSVSPQLKELQISFN